MLKMITLIQQIFHKKNNIKHFALKKKKKKFENVNFVFFGSRKKKKIFSLTEILKFL